MAADHSHIEGDYPRNDPKYSPYKHGMWTLKSKLSELEPFEAHLDGILALVEPKREYLRELGKSVTIDFYCVLYDQTGFQLSPQILERIAGIGATLGVTVECPDDHSHEEDK